MVKLRKSSPKREGDHPQDGGGARAGLRTLVASMLDGACPSMPPGGAQRSRSRSWQDQLAFFEHS